MKIHKKIGGGGEGSSRGGGLCGCERRSEVFLKIKNESSWESDVNEELKFCENSK